MEDFKIRILNGQVFDSGVNTFNKRDLYIIGKEIVSKEIYLSRNDLIEKNLEATGLFVSPGLIDMHTHVFKGQDLGVDPDKYCLPFGTTTVLDAGSAGAHLLEAFKTSVVNDAKTNIFALLNISTIGTTSILLKGELTSEYCSVDEAKKVFDRYQDFLIGIKVRASHNVGGDFTLEALRRARRVADDLSVPLMVHLGPAPATVEDILNSLNPGDILTHAFTGWNNSLTKDFQIKEVTRKAIDRGVILDVGHGMGGFDSSVAKILIEGGVYPKTISTDIHSYSLTDCKNLPHVMSKFIALGMSLEDVLSATTITPSNLLNLTSKGYGSLEHGSPADLLIFALTENQTIFRDCHGHEFEGKFIIDPIYTIKSGEVISAISR